MIALILDRRTPKPTFISVIYLATKYFLILRQNGIINLVSLWSKDKTVQTVCEYSYGSTIRVGRIVRVYSYGLILYS